MILDRPVAALDYHNVPRFVPTAWTISAPEHIAPVVSQLLRPDARRMAFQRDSLRDCLECDGPAAPRVAALIERMAAGAATARRSGGAARPLSGAGTVDPDGTGGDGHGPAHAGGSPSLADLYPEQTVFAEQDVQRLQVRLARAEKDRERLERELRGRSVARRLYALGKSLAGGRGGSKS